MHYYYYSGTGRGVIIEYISCTGRGTGVSSPPPTPRAAREHKGRPRHGVLVSRGPLYARSGGIVGVKGPEWRRTPAFVISFPYLFAVPSEKGLAALVYWSRTSHRGGGGARISCSAIITILCVVYTYARIRCAAGPRAVEECG